NSSYKAINRFWFMIFIRQAFRCEFLFAGVDRCVICLVVDYQKGKFRNNFLPSHGIYSVCDVVSQPFQKAIQDGLVFLDDEEPRSFFWCYADIAGETRTEITILKSCCNEVRANGWVNFPNAYQFLLVATWICFIPQESFIESHLSLRS